MSPFMGKSFVTVALYMVKIGQSIGQEKFLPFFCRIYAANKFPGGRGGYMSLQRTRIMLKHRRLIFRP